MASASDAERAQAITIARRLLDVGDLQGAVGVLRPILEKAVEVGPEHAFYLRGSIALGRRREALAELDRALCLPISSGDSADALAFYARQLDRHDASNALYWRAVGLVPGDPQFWYNIATSERSLGRLESAASAASKALALDPDFPEAIFLRSELTRATARDNNVAELQARLAGSSAGHRRVLAAYALGKELHDLGRYDEAFAAFAEGAASRRRNLSYDVSRDEAKLRRIEEVFAGMDAPPRSGRIDRHIFIVGLPRSGTTLTERILSGLPNVRSNNETDNFANALFRHASVEGADIFERAARADFQAVAGEYEALAAHNGFRGSIIEKLPFNYLYIGAILRAFPDTPIVWVRRHPLDVCFAMFRTLFGAAYPFSYDFVELARYYAAYDRLMGVWVREFPEQIIPVDYEDLVATPSAIGRRVAERCGLSWSDSALEISANAAVSLTASAAQVRGEIYRSSSGVWQRYARHLAPLAARLVASGIKPDPSP